MSCSAGDYLKVVIVSCFALFAGTVFPGAAMGGDGASSSEAAFDSPRDVLSPQQRQRVDQAVDRALAWLAGRQRKDGSFPSPDTGQPAVTSLCVLAFLARGHLPGEGPYGEGLNRAIDFVISCQKPDGLLSYVEPGPRWGTHNAAQTAAYNHAMAGLLLCEAYGMAKGAESAGLRAGIEKAVAFTRELQMKPKPDRRDRGGLRYVRRWAGGDSDLSITSWHLLFLRSAKNAGFAIPTQYVDEAVAYVKRCFDSRAHTFIYSVKEGHRFTTRAMAGAGVLSLSLGGLHGTEMARRAGESILRRPFNRYNASWGKEHGYHYAAFYCTQGMYQLGGRFWREFFPVIAKAMVDNQMAEGSWAPETGTDGYFGNTYTTALGVLILTTPYQLLPVFQR